MLGKRPSQSNLFSADAQYLDFVGKDTFYGWLAQEGRKLFRDEDFACMYCLDNGRTSVPPGRLVIALLLQTHDRVCDEEAKRRADMDLGWKVALGIKLDERPFAKSTLQLFRAQLLIHDQARQVFIRSLEYAKAQGFLRNRKMKAALDTTHILGRGAAQDTYNLIAEGIRQLSRELARAAGEEWESWLGAHALGRYAEPSIKGAAEVDWDNAASREGFLGGLIDDGKQALELARHARAQLEADSEADGRIADAAELLTTLLWQDVEPTERGHRIKQGTAQDRIPSAHDPEQRHGHKSRGKTFTGHKAAVAVEVDSQLITAVEVIAGNAGDGECAAALVEQSEANTGAQVEQVIGDTAYGSMQVRQELGEREVIAPTPKPGNYRTIDGERQRVITKLDFDIDTEGDVVRCPAGQESRQWQWVRIKDRHGKRVRVKRFAFAKELCRACALHPECVGDKRRRGRTITLHPQEAALQQARAFERTDYFREQYRKRVVVEHRNARLVGLGMRQARYFGHSKTLLQLLLAATVANLTLVAGKMRQSDNQRRYSVIFALRHGVRRFIAALRGLPRPWLGFGRIIFSPSDVRLQSPWALPTPAKSPAFRLGF
jgi:hypothetical protein